MITIKHFLIDESGLELSEYAISVALLAVLLIVAFTQLGSTIKSKLEALAASFMS